MSGSRRLSQAISEGDGISLIAAVRSADEARAAEAAGAEALALAEASERIRGVTGLPVLWRGAGLPASDHADACTLDAQDDVLHAEVIASGLEPVVAVHDEEELEDALRHLDPEILLLSGTRAEADEDPLDRVLSLLPDLPAGKLAIAEVEVATREDVLALERAGIDAVLVQGLQVSALVGGAVPPV